MIVVTNNALEHDFANGNLYRNCKQCVLKYELIYQLDAIEYLSSFSSTCFGLTRPSSGAMDVTISLHMQHMVSLV